MEEWRPLLCNSSVHTCQQLRRRYFLSSVRWLYHEYEASSRQQSSDNWEVSQSSPVSRRVFSSVQFSASSVGSSSQLVPDKKCYKIVKWIIVARPRKGQINKALNKHSTSCYVTQPTRDNIKCSLYLTGNTLRLHYRDQTVNTVKGKNSLFIVRNETHKYTLCEQNAER
jgi:hypothetical protein